MRTTSPAVIVLLLACCLGLAACDAVTETATPAIEADVRAQRSPDRTSARTDPRTAETRQLSPACHPARQAWSLGRRTPASSACATPPPVPSCTCFSAEGLAASVQGAAPEVHLSFDTFNFWNEDYRRTEVRAALDLDGRRLEKVAAVYIPRGIEANPLPVMCYHQDVVDSEEGDWEMTYTTREITILEAEACRRAATAFAGGEPCLGGACGRPYTPDQLSPSYPYYENEGEGRPSLFLLDLDRRRSAFDPSVSRFAR